ncbi:MAG TPA: hypothetical protein VEI02_04585 [Planctomycetota bacterium]|nr:hypothetical protein [Planctomycetota bacterium]
MTAGAALAARPDAPDKTPWSVAVGVFALIVCLPSLLAFGVLRLLGATPRTGNAVMRTLAVAALVPVVVRYVQEGGGSPWNLLWIWIAGALWGGDPAYRRLARSTEGEGAR